jgi:hypothetical protein
LQIYNTYFPHLRNNLSGAAIWQLKETSRIYGLKSLEISEGSFSVEMANGSKWSTISDTKFVFPPNPTDSTEQEPIPENLVAVEKKRLSDLSQVVGLLIRNNQKPKCCLRNTLGYVIENGSDEVREYIEKNPKPYGLWFAYNQHPAKVFSFVTMFGEPKEIRYFQTAAISNPLFRGKQPTTTEDLMFRFGIQTTLEYIKDNEGCVERKRQTLWFAEELEYIKDNEGCVERGYIESKLELGIEYVKNTTFYRYVKSKLELGIEYFKNTTFYKYVKNTTFYKFVESEFKNTAFYKNIIIQENFDKDLFPSALANHPYFFFARVIKKYFKKNFIDFRKNYIKENLGKTNITNWLIDRVQVELEVVYYSVKTMVSNELKYILWRRKAIEDMVAKMEKDNEGMLVNK